MIVCGHVASGKLDEGQGAHHGRVGPTRVSVDILKDLYSFAVRDGRREGEPRGGERNGQLHYFFLSEFGLHMHARTHGSIQSRVRRRFGDSIDCVSLRKRSGGSRVLSHRVNSPLHFYYELVSADDDVLWTLALHTVFPRAHSGARPPLLSCH